MNWFKKQRTIDKILMQLDKIAFNDEQAKEKLYMSCQEQISKNKDTIDFVFEKWFALGKEFKENPQENGFLLYQLTDFIASRKYLPGYHEYRTSFREIAHIPKKFENEFCNLLESILDVTDYIIIEKQNFRNHGNVGNIAETIFGIYKGCIDDYRQEAEMMSKLSKYIKPFAQKFPNNAHYAIADALEQHPNAIETTVEILLLLIDKKAEKGLMQSILGEMINPFSRDNYFHQQAPAITLQLVEKYQSISEIKKDWFLAWVLQELGIDLRTKAIQINVAKELLATLMNNPEKYKMAIPSREKELQELETNFENIQEKSWKRAYKKIAVSPKIRKTLEILAKHNEGLANTVHIKQLLKAAADFKNAPKLYLLNQKPTIIFKDLHFKLWIIEELMYKQKLLTPKFELEKLAQEHTAREINREDDGYKIIPEVKKYFKNLDIPEDLLLKVKTIEVSYLSEVYNHLWPFCDAGCGDELLSVSSKMIDDLALVPNLNKIICFEDLSPSAKVIKAVEEKNIILESCKY